MEPNQFITGLVISSSLFILIIRLIQKRKLDIAYCWVWMIMGVAMLVVVLRYDWLVWFTHFIGAVSPTTTLFLFAIIIILMLCLQFSIIMSTHRQHIKRLTQRLAIDAEKNKNE